MTAKERPKKLKSRADEESEQDSGEAQDLEQPGHESIRRSHEDRSTQRRKTTKHRERLPEHARTDTANSANLIECRIIQTDGQFFVAALPNGSELRAKTTKSTRSAEPNATLVTVGDRVMIDPQPDNVALITEVLPRSTKLLRRASGRNDAFAQVIVANIDLLVIVVSILEPPLRAGIIDRYIVAGLEGGMDIAIVFNKIDLLRSAPAKAALNEYLSLYQSIGYPTFGVSANEPSTFIPLREFLDSKTSVFAGHSGVGKTSLINAMMGFQIGSTGLLSKKFRRGAHTTSRSLLLKMGDISGTYIVDTPGVREFANHAIDPNILKFSFEEFTAFAERCAITNCSHLHEPGCAVIDAVEQGEISVERYASYEKLYEEAEAQDKKRRERS